MRAGSPWNANRPRASRNQLSQDLVLGEKLERQLIGTVDVLGIAGERNPAERPLPGAEQRPDILRNKSGDEERIDGAGVEGEAADVVAVVERDCPGSLEREHGVDVHDHRGGRAADVFLGVALPQIRSFTQREPLRHVAVERIVGAGLVGNHVHLHAAADNLRQHVGAVADKAHRKRPALAARGLAQRQRFVQRFGHGVAIARVKPALDAGAVDLDAQHHAVIQRDRKRLRAAHSAHAAGDHQLALERSRPIRLGEMPLGQRSEGLKSALQNALRPDVNPASRRHLAEHDEALLVELVEMLPGGPLAHQVGVGDDDARGHVVRGKHADGLAGLDQQRLFIAQPLKLAHDGVVAVPVACGLADAAVDDQVRRPLAHLGIEVVHQAAQGGFLLPALAVELGAAEGTDGWSDGRGSHGVTWRQSAPQMRVARLGGGRRAGALPDDRAGFRRNNRMTF